MPWLCYYSVPTAYYESWNDRWVYRYLWERFYHYPTEEEMKKAEAVFHSDAGTWDFKEPGPRWFRNQFETRPSRRKNKRELQKYMLDPEYEPMCFTKGPLEYWT
jgi:hypothetical protein